MNTTHRLVLAMLFMLIVAGPVTHAALSTSALEERQEQVDAIKSVMKGTTYATSSTQGARALQIEGEDDLKEVGKTLSSIGKNKRNIRLQLVSRLDDLNEFKEKYGVDPSDEKQINVFIADQKVEMSHLLRRYARVQYLSKLHITEFDSLFDKIFGFSSIKHLDENLRLQALSRIKIRVFDSIIAMGDFPRELENIRSLHVELLTSYHASLDDYDFAMDKIALGKEQLNKIKRTVAAVEAKVRQMQAQLIMYDERIRSRAEGDLISKGLISKHRRSSSIPLFQWPVVGRITAKFLDPSYHAYFGIPHKAIDIAQSQGTSVRASADGVVYHIQRGGKGYSYILIGHRGGYATLYGHMLKISVAPGEDIYGGQIIGLSGGIPGTSGAGLMTTGAPVHFEVIQNGIHLDPLTILP